MKIIVCAKVVFDPEAPAACYQIDPQGHSVVLRGVQPVINPFDENALEAALKLKSALNATVVLLSLGKSIPKALIWKALAAGADDAFLLEDDWFSDLDGYTAAAILAAAIRKIGPSDLIICGRQAADTNSGQIGLLIAEILGIPSVSLAGRIEMQDNRLIVERILDYGTETLSLNVPALITVGNEIGALRSANLKAVLNAQKKMLKSWNAQDLGVPTRQLSRVKTCRFFQKAPSGNCVLVSADSPEAAAVQLAQRLKEQQII